MSVIGAFGGLRTLRVHFNDANIFCSAETSESRFSVRSAYRQNPPLGGGGSRRAMIVRVHIPEAHADGFHFAAFMH
jgi:hypothetical protein